MQKRPGLVTAVAIVNIVFGLLCGCLAVMTMATPTLVQKGFGFAQEVQNHALQTLRESGKALDETESQKRADEQFARTHSDLLSAQAKFVNTFATPRMKASYAISGGVDGLLRLLLLISGIGLLCMAGWARRLAIGVSIALIVAAVIHPLVAHAVFGDEVMQAVQNMHAELAQQSQQMTASLEKDVQRQQAEMDKDPQLATPEAKANLQRTKSLLEMTKVQQKQFSTTGQSFAPTTNNSSSARVMKVFWTAVLMLLGCVWPVACILMLRTATVRDAFAAGDRLRV